MTTATHIVVALSLSIPTLAAARVEVLTVGKFARFESRGDPARTEGFVHVGRDRALRVLHDPACPGTSRVEILSKLEGTARHVLLAIDLDCTKWQARDGGWRYRDRGGALRTIRYAPGGLDITVRGAGPLDGPVNLLQAQLSIGDTTLRARPCSTRASCPAPTLTA